jgi:hypothetical protein
MSNDDYFHVTFFIFSLFMIILIIIANLGLLYSIISAFGNAVCNFVEGL